MKFRHKPAVRVLVCKRCGRRTWVRVGEELPGEYCERPDRSWTCDWDEL